MLHAPSRSERASIGEALLEAARALELWYSKGEQRAVHYLHTATRVHADSLKPIRPAVPIKASR